MTPFKSELPDSLIELGKKRGFDASVVVPSAIGLPAKTGVSHAEFERQAEQLFEDSERFAEEDLAHP